MKTPRDLEADQEQAYTNSLPFQISSRLKAFLSGSSKSSGASCNTFKVEDSIEGIGEAAKWGLDVLAYQGAPSWDLSNLRPAQSPVSSGGTSSGAVSFGRIYDSIISQMRRAEKKNGAGILALDYRHPELKAFLNEPYKNAYKIVYVPSTDNKKEVGEFFNDSLVISTLVKAYNEFKCFLVKRPHHGLLVNLCTEVEIPHKGFCILGSFNLSYFTPANIHLMPSFFKLAALKMVFNEEKVWKNTLYTKLTCDNPLNRQFGLGIYGLASVLGAWGISYEEFNDSLLTFGVKDLFIAELADVVEPSPINRSDNFVYWLIKSYYEASRYIPEYMKAAFCIQPTVSTSQRSFDNYGYNVSAEVQPVNGIKFAGSVNGLRKSAIKGDKVESYHPRTWTIDEVPYSTYALTSSLLQQLMESTGLAHRHSHCFYGEEFTTQDLRDFYYGDTSHRKSLYYRLPHNANNDSLKKDTLWQAVEDKELYDGSLDFSGCQLFGEIDCECQD